MLVQITALAYSLFGILLGYGGSRRVLSPKELNRFFVAWVLITISLFLISEPLVFLGLAALILIASKPSDKSQYLAFYILALHMVPFKVGALIPFPGLNYLILLDFPKLSAAVILVPLLFWGSREPTGQNRKSKLDWLIILYFMFISALAFRELPFTSGLRSSFDLGILILVTYFAARNAISSVGDMNRFVRYWVILCVVLAILALMTQYKYWNFYDSISGALIKKLFVLPGFGNFRGDILRSTVTLGPTILGFTLSMGVVFAQFLKRQFANKLGWLRLMQMLFLGAIYGTHSRGAWLALLVMVILYADFFVRSSATRSLIRLALVIGGVIGVLALELAGFFALDEYGTFQYRYDLIINAWQLIKEYPFFGIGSSFGAYDNTVLEASRQGQGIIDIVNTYLQVALNSGLVGAAMFLSIFAIPVVNLRTMARRLGSEQLAAEQDYCNLMIVVLIGLAALLFTISWVGILPYYTFLLVGVAAGVTALAKAALAGRRQRESLAGTDVPDKD